MSENGARVTLAYYTAQPRVMDIWDGILSSPSDHCGRHGGDQVPEVPEEAGVEGQTVQ